MVLLIYNSRHRFNSNINSKLIFSIILLSAKCKVIIILNLVNNKFCNQITSYKKEIKYIL